MGTSHSVYFANDCGQDMYVIASLNPWWALADFIVDVTLLAAGITEVKSVATAAELPEAFVTIRDLFDFLYIAGKLALGMIGTGTRSADAGLALLNAFKKTAIKISDQDYKDVYSDNVLNYLNADGIAAIGGADTVSVMVMSGDGKQLALWDTGSDQSWIATSSNRIVRSKYGTIWEQDPDTWTAIWPDIYAEFPWGDGNDDLETGKAYIISIRDTAKVFVANILRCLRVEPYDPKNQSQYWLCTDSSADTIGFLNAGTRRFLGRDSWQNLACYASEQNGWERLTMTSLAGGGYRLYAHLDDGSHPTALKSDTLGEYMQVVADSDTVIGLQAV